MNIRRSAPALLLATLPLAAPAAALAALAPMAAVAADTAAEYTIDPAHSVFAVLTHKAGIGSGLAHDHLVVAPKPTVKLDFDPASPEATKLTFKVGVEALEVDAPGPRAAWKGRFKELGIHSGELPLVSDSDRGKVRAAMLGESQLNGAKFPEIQAEVLALERRDASASGASRAGGAAGGASAAPGWSVRLRLTIRGKTIERQLRATWSEQAGTLTAEIHGELHFKDFGIEPYSTLFGAIRNDDLFHLYVNVVAHRAPPGAP